MALLSESLLLLSVIEWACLETIGFYTSLAVLLRFIEDQMITLRALASQILLWVEKDFKSIVCLITALAVLATLSLAAESLIENETLSEAGK